MASSSSAASAAALGDASSPSLPRLLRSVSSPSHSLPLFISEAVQVLVASLADDSPVARDAALAALREVAPL